MLKEPLLPIKLVESEIYSDGKLNTTKLVKRLDPIRYTTLLYVLTFMSEVLKNKDSNKVDSFYLTTLFANVIIRNDPTNSNSKTSPPIKNCIKIMNTLLKLVGDQF